MSREHNSYERKRVAGKPLVKWRAQVKELEVTVRAELGLADAASPSAEDLVSEVVRLADAYAMDGLDVVIPGTRVDLARRWMQERFGGRGTTPEDRLALARETAPLPDAHLLAQNDRKAKKTRYVNTNLAQDKVTDAAEKYYSKR